MQSFPRLVTFIYIIYSAAVQALPRVGNFQDVFSNVGTSGENQLSDVTVELYYETLCPKCQAFYSGVFNRTAIKWFDRLDLKTVPYGKASRQVSYNGTYHFACQHGEVECYGNKLHACLLHYTRGPTRLSLNFCACMEQQRGEDMDANADTCAKMVQLDPEPLKECAKSNLGNLLLWNAGEETEAVNLKFVPHVRVNGLHVPFEEFEKYVCQAFTYPPPECDQLLKL